MSTAQTINLKLATLSEEDSYIFLFYLNELKSDTLGRIPIKVGSVIHRKLLIDAASKDPSLCNIYSALKGIKHSHFHYKAKNMASLAREAIRLGASPEEHLPKAVQGKQTSVLNTALEGMRLPSPTCPFVQGNFSIMSSHKDSQRKSHTFTNVSVTRVLISPLVSLGDVTSKWITPKILQVGIKYPDIMNDVLSTIHLVNDSTGAPVFGKQHQLVHSLEQGLQSRRDNDGNIIDNFFIEFEDDQDRRFFPLNDVFTGFDVLKARHVDKHGEAVHFKLLQVATRQLDHEENAEGEAHYIDLSQEVHIFSSPDQRAAAPPPFAHTSHQQKTQPKQQSMPQYHQQDEAQRHREEQVRHFQQEAQRQEFHETKIRQEQGTLHRQQEQLATSMRELEKYMRAQESQQPQHHQEQQQPQQEEHQDPQPAQLQSQQHHHQQQPQFDASLVAALMGLGNQQPTVDAVDDMNRLSQILSATRI